MADLLIRNIDDDVYDRLEKLASSHGHTVEEEVLNILRKAVGNLKRATAEGIGSRIAARFSGRGIGLTEEEAKLIQEFRGDPARPVDFDR